MLFAEKNVKLIKWVVSIAKESCDQIMEDSADVLQSGYYGFSGGYYGFSRIKWKNQIAYKVYITLQARDFRLLIWQNDTASPNLRQLSVQFQTRVLNSSSNH